DAGKQPLVYLDRSLHLPGLAQQRAQDLEGLDGVRRLPRDLAQLADRESHLSRGEIVHPLRVVGERPEAEALPGISGSPGLGPGAADDHSRDAPHATATA